MLLSFPRITSDFAGVLCQLSRMASSYIRRESSYSKIKTVGGSPTASHFFLLRQRKSNQKEGAPGLPPLRGALRCSTGQAAAELALRAQTVLAESP